MIIGLLLLALLPLALLPDMFSSDADDAQDQSDAEPPPAGVSSLLHDADIAHDFDVSVVDLLDADPSDGSGETDPSVLEPVIEDDQADAGNQEPNPDDILAPVIEDDTATPPTEPVGEVLEPVIEDDSESGIAWVQDDAHAEEVHAKVEGFQIGEDVLQISLRPNAAEISSEVAVVPSDDGEDSLVYVGDHLVAVLIGVPDATVADVVVDSNWLAA